MSKIEWCDETINPVAGCTKVSPACDNCYAEPMAARLAHMAMGPKGKQKTFEKYYGLTNLDGKWTGEVHLDLSEMDKPLKWKKSRRIFVVSMGDLFHEKVPFEFLKTVLFRMLRPTDVKEWHTFILLTKRPERMKEFFEWLETEPQRGEWTVEWPLPNVWLGVTAENQEQADLRIPVLLSIPAAVHWISYGPGLGPLKLRKCWICKGPDVEGCLCEQDTYGPLRWVVAEGESGLKARPPHPQWFLDLMKQCQAAGVPFFFKQWGEWVHDGKPTNKTLLTEGANMALIVPFKGEVTTGLLHYDPETSVIMRKVGKKSAGRLLDGREWNQFPKVKA